MAAGIGRCAAERPLRKVAGRLYRGGVRRAELRRWSAEKLAPRGRQVEARPEGRAIREPQPAEGSRWRPGAKARRKVRPEPEQCIVAISAAQQ